MAGLTPFGQQFLAFAQSVTASSRLRLAPTPSGFLHAGNAFNFILNWLAARLQPGASLLLRIDDLDADRKRSEYVQDIFDTLDWLGLASSTTSQQFLANCLRRPAFSKIQFLHHALLLDQQGVKLSKSAGAEALKTSRLTHQTPETIYRSVAEMLLLPSTDNPTNSSELLAALSMK